MSDRNKNIARHFIEEAWSKGNISIVDGLFAPAAAHHDPSTPDFGPGPEGEKKRIALYRGAFPDLRFTIDDMIAEGETVVTRWSSHGTHKGDLAGIPPTNKTVSSSGITITRFADGKVVETWVSWDTLGMLRQLGVAPALSSVG